MSQPILQAKNVWKEYGDVCVLERINVSINAGEFVTVVGASGCGKSTFLKLVLGTESVSRGELLLDGQLIPQEPDEHRGIVFQKYSVFPHLTALGNVLLADEFSQSPWLGKLFGAVQQKGYACVALSLYWKNAWCKVKIGVAKGKKQHDKRSDLKDREWQLDKARIMKHAGR